MIDRREFMKLFGVGCAIVPLVGGVPVGAAESKLIEVPKVTLAESPSLAGPVEIAAMNIHDRYHTTVIFERSDGGRIFLEGNSFITKVEMGLSVPKSRSGVISDAYARSHRLMYTLSGEFLANKNGELLTVVES